jgi:hypothetical protein
MERRGPVPRPLVLGGKPTLELGVICFRWLAASSSLLVRHTLNNQVHKAHATTLGIPLHTTPFTIVSSDSIALAYILPGQGSGSTFPRRELKPCSQPEQTRLTSKQAGQVAGFQVSTPWS